MKCDEDISSLDDIKNDRYVIEHIMWDIEPKQLLEPTCKTEKDKGIKYIKKLEGYLFYIDIMVDKKPTLFLMCHTDKGYAETVAQIDEIPDELIVGAIDENKDREFFGMYPVNNKVKDWLKREFGIQD